MRIAAAVLALVLAPAVLADAVKGRAMSTGGPLPGCRVTLSNAGASRKTVADAEGRYQFLAVAPGTYTLTLELEGLTTETRSVSVADENVIVEYVELQLAPEPEQLTVSCSIALCSDADAPSTPYDQPLCTDDELNRTLITAMEGGDRSARDLLERRYDTAVSYYARHTIARALLGRARDDRKYWNDLSRDAADALRFAYVDGEATPEYLEWCEARDVDPDDHRNLMISALFSAATDRRGRTLLDDALKSPDFSLVEAGIVAIIDKHDETDLPKVEAALKRFPDRAEDTALLLVAFRSEAADRVAVKFVSEERYGAERRSYECLMTGCEP